MDGGEIRGAGNAWICPEVLLRPPVDLFRVYIKLVTTFSEATL